MDTLKILEEAQSGWATANPKELIGLRIVELLCNGKTPMEIRETLEITNHVLDTALAAIAARVNLPKDRHTFKACPDLIHKNLDKFATYTSACQSLEKQYRDSLLTFEY